MKKIQAIQLENQGKKDMNRYYTEEYIQVTNKHMNGCLTSLAIREMQI